MFRFPENLVGPLTGYGQTDTPPGRPLPFLADCARQWGRVPGAGKAGATE